MLLMRFFVAEFAHLNKDKDYAKFAETVQCEISFQF